MYQEDFHLSHYWQLSPKFPPQHAENGKKSPRFPPIIKVNLRGWPFNPDLLFRDIPNAASEWCQQRLLIEHSVRVQSSSTQFNCGLEEIVVFVSFPRVAADILGTIANNAMSSWYIGTKMEEIGDVLVIKLSVWKSVTYLWECWIERKDW